MAVPVTGTIAPYPAGTYASIDSLTGIDGWRSVADTTERNAITALRRRQGMIVVVQADTGGGPNIPWQLTAASPWAFDDSDWTQLFSVNLGGLTFIASCRVATAAALTATYANGTLGVGATLTNATTQAAISIDGVSLSSTNRVLVKNQAAPAQNGIYTVTTVGSGATNWVLTRATDYDQSAEVLQGTYTVISEGTANAETLWIQVQPSPITIGTTAITFLELKITGGTGSVTSVATGTGLTGGPITSSGTISIAVGGVGTTQLAVGAVDTPQIAVSAVSYANIQDEAAHSLLGNPTGSAAAPSEITLGAGLAFSGTTLVAAGGGAPVASWLLGPDTPLEVANDVTVNWYPVLAGTISGALINAKGGASPSGPTGSALLVDIKLSSNGGSTWTSLWHATPANRPNIDDGNTIGTAGPTDTTSRSLGDLLRVDVLAVGSSTPGSNISLVLY